MRIAGRGRVDFGRDRRSSPARDCGGSASRPSAGRWCRRCRTARRDRCRRAASTGIGSAANSASILGLPMTISRSRLAGACGATSVVETRRREAHARAGMLEDVAKLAPVQLGVRRHRGEAARARCRRSSRDIRRSSWRRSRRDRRASSPSAMQRARKPRGALGQLRRSSAPRAGRSRPPAGPDGSSPRATARTRCS